MSVIVRHLSNFSKQFQNGVEEGYMLAMATSKGYTLVYIIDIVNKKMNFWNNYKKVEGNPSSS